MAMLIAYKVLGEFWSIVIVFKVPHVLLKSDFKWCSCLHYIYFILHSAAQTARNNSVVGSNSPPQEGKATQGHKRAHYCAKKPATVSQKTVSNTTLYAYARRHTRTVTTEHKRSDFMIGEIDKTQPIQKQKAVTDYKEEVDRHPPTPPTLSTGKLKSGRTNTTTTDITTRSPISEQWPQEIAHVT